MKVLLTGASGFVGRAMASRLLQNRDIKLTIAVRNKPNWVSDAVPVHIVSTIDSLTDWSSAVAETTAIIHSAARVHVMNEHSDDPLAEFRKVNVEGTLNLAKQAAEAGVSRFIFISSIKVNGEKTYPGQIFSAEDVPAPSDPYGISKLEAEQCLLSLANKTGMEVTIIRPVLIYGPGVKANFLSMMKWLQRGLPLPFGAINNKRSLVALDNLVDLIYICLKHPAAANQVFLISDGEDLSTTELLRRMGKALKKPARLFPVSPAWLNIAFMLIGKRDVAQRLCESLQVDIEKTQRLLDWHPLLSVDQGLKRAAEGLKK